MNWNVLLRLGRVSNLPTVWTNSLAALLLAGGTALDPKTLPLLLSMTLFYIGGMYLNDAFDAGIDARERPERPIPSGQISRTTVFTAGFTMLLGGLLLLLWIGLDFSSSGFWPAIGGLGLAAAIIFYNYHHKANPLSPVVMGLCRFMVYISVALCFALPLPALIWLGGGLLICYLIGLTYTAKQENLNQIGNLWPLLFLAAPVLYGAFVLFQQASLHVLIFWLIFSGWIVVALYFLKRRKPGDIPRAVVSLIAGISLFDALLIATATDGIYWAIVAVAGFLLTLALQRFVPGT